MKNIFNNDSEHRLLSMLLVIIMLLSLIPINVIAVDSEKTSSGEEQDSTLLSEPDDVPEVEEEPEIPPEVEALVWDVSSPPSIKWNDPSGFVNTVSGGSGNGAVSYSSNNTAVADVDSVSGVLTLKAAGNVTITATKEADGVYPEQTASYSLTVERADQTITFENGTIALPAISYSESTSSYQNAAIANTQVTYSSSDESVATVDKTTGAITTHKAGTVTITATAEQSDQYNSASASYEITVKRAEQTLLLIFEKGTIGQEVTYGDNSYKNVATGGNTAPITYSSSDKQIADVDQTGAIIPKAQGTVTITATAEQSDQYNSASASYEITVKRAEQTVVFANGTTDIPAIKYKESYQNVANAITSITYKSSDETVATVDNTGVLTTLKAGTVTITATAEQTEQYNEASASYTITVNTADQTIEFPQSVYEIVNGDKKFTAPKSSEGAGKGEIVYSIDADADNVIKAIDTKTGELTFTGNVGTVTIRATKVADTQYSEAFAIYTLKVKSWTPTKTITSYIDLVDAKGNTNFVWFAGGNVSIDAKDGYTISSSCDASTGWVDKLEVVTKDGEHVVKFYIRENETGYISAEQTVTVCRDTTKPIAEISSYAFDNWDVALSIASNSYSELRFTICGEDLSPSADGGEIRTSGIAKIEYYVDYDAETVMSDDDLDNLAPTAWAEYGTNVGVLPDARFVVYAKVMDNAGNYTYAKTNLIIFDRTAVATADITSSATSEKPAIIVNNIERLFNGDVKIAVTASDKAPSSGIKSVKYIVYNNGKKTQEGLLYTGGASEYSQLTYSWTSDSKNPSTYVLVSAKLNDSDDIKVEIVVTDNAGNETTKAIEKFRIDATAPQISIDFDNNNGNIYEGRGYFGGERTATISITERSTNFIEADASNGISITANGKALNGNSQDIEISGWTAYDTEDSSVKTYVATVKFKADNNYTLNVEYTDRAGNKNGDIIYGTGVVAPVEFTVDQTKPDATITVDERSWSNLVAPLRFSIFKSQPMKVSITAMDVTSPFDITYYKTSDTEAKSSAELDSITNWIPYSEFYVSANERFVVYAKIEDKAGNYIYISSDGHIVDAIGPDISMNVPETDLDHDGVPLYTGDIRIDIFVSDRTESYSGIKTIEYWVTCDGVETERGLLYYFSEAEPTHDQLLQSYSYTVTIDAESNNSCDVLIYVAATDNAGNYSEEHTAVDIDVSAPKIDVTYDNNEYYKLLDGKGYFPNARKATVVITERAGHFDNETAKKSINITAVDIAKNVIIEDCSTLIGAWTTSGVGNEAKHTTTIDFSADANYTLEISYTDIATNVNEAVNAGDSSAPYNFAVDTSSPLATIEAEGLGKWNELVETLTFGIWSKNDVIVKANAEDAISPIESVSYYKTADIKEKTVDELNAISGWITGDKISTASDERMTVYAKVVDYAGNITYVSTDGIIVDTNGPEFEAIGPEITITPEPSNGIYNDDVTVSVAVSDPKVGSSGAYSGLREVRYEVYNMGALTQSGVLYSFDYTNPTYDQLIQTWKKIDAIVVDKNLNNSNDVKIVVYAVDNVGNSGKVECYIKIDTTAPIIEVSYDNNDGNTAYGDQVFFGVNRTAKITITERNFDASMVKVDLTNSDGYIPEITAWITTQGDDNGDNTTHIAYIVFDGDGDYTFDISCVDIASNVNTEIDYTQSLAPNAFTIDKTLPNVRVVYDNNAAVNNNYYNAVRSATIIVTEHNFDAGNASVMLSATDNGSPIALPTVSNWTSNGDVHTATIRYVQDGRYTFDFDFADMAGNVAIGIPEEIFYIDTVSPSVSIKNIVDESANNDEGNIGFVITATDTNFDVFIPTITAVIRKDDTFEIKQIDVGEFANITNGKTYTVENIDTDGIYRISCTVIDSAGNAFSEVLLEDLGGDEYSEERCGDDTLLTFSVNRDGSTYDLGEITVWAIENSYIQNLDGDIVIVEINVDSLVEYNVTLNEKVLNEGGDYTVVEEGGKGAWMKYTYTVSKALFGDEGEYKLVVSSKDEAENDAFSDIKDATVSFVVDRTAPIVTVSGLATNGRYQTDKQVVTLIPTDDGGALNSITVFTVDNDGNVIETLVDLSGEAFINALDGNDGKIVFEIAEGLYQNVRIVCRDRAMSAVGSTNTYDETFENVSVSSSAFMIFWANKPLRWSIIGGIGVLGVVAAVLVVLKKKKKS